MTIVFIENILGSGQMIKVLEDFGDYVVEHRLQPGDNARIAVSRFKSIIVNEFVAASAVGSLAFRRPERRPAATARA
jgi:hypothetical protein